MVISIFIDTGGGALYTLIKISILKTRRISPTLPFGRQGFIDSQVSVAAKQKPVCFWPLTMREVQNKPGAIQPFPFLYNFHFTAL